MLRRAVSCPRSLLLCFIIEKCAASVPLKFQSLAKIAKSLIFWQGQQGSNLWPAVLETAALPTELYPYKARAVFYPNWRALAREKSKEKGRIAPAFPIHSN